MSGRDWLCPKCGETKTDISVLPFTCGCGFRDREGVGFGEPSAVVEAVSNPKPATKKRDPCVHRGEVIRQELCPSCCGGKVELFIFACTQHGECTIGKKLESVACCKKCKDYLSSGGESPLSVAPAGTDSPPVSK